VSLRKPPAVPAAAELFVHAGGGGDGPTPFKVPPAEVPERPAVKAPERPSAKPSPTRSAMVTRSDGRELRRMTIYLPADLAKRLAVRCAELDADLSAVIAEAVAKHLDA
jgi:hypothetical protein